MAEIGMPTDLSKYRLGKAHSLIGSSELLLENQDYSGSLNRSYYAIFHTLRAVTALDGFDSKKHSGIIAYFNHHYFKPDIIDRKYSKMITKAFNIRNEADYEDFYIASKADAQEQLEHAKEFLEVIQQYLQERYNREEN